MIYTEGSYPSWYVTDDRPHSGYPINEFPDWNFAEGGNRLSRGWWCSYGAYVLCVPCNAANKPYEFLMRSKVYSDPSIVNLLRGRPDFTTRGNWLVIWTVCEGRVQPEEETMAIVDDLIMEMML